MKQLDAQHLALELMKQHKLYDWTFRWSRAKTRFGNCNYKTKTISLSWPITSRNDEVHVRDTILHEIAHALAGSKAGHGRIWKAMARSVGARAERCYSSADVVTPQRQWVGTCPNGHDIHRHRRTLTGSCARCSKTFDPRYKLVWRRA